MPTARPVPLALARPVNAAILARLAAWPQAHGDLVDELDLAIAGLGLQTWCPSPREFTFVAAYPRSGTIVALAIGMQALLVRAPARGEPGVAPAPEYGPDWSSVALFTGPGTLADRRRAARAQVEAAIAAR